MNVSIRNLIEVSIQFCIRVSMKCYVILYTVIYKESMNVLMWFSVRGLVVD